MQTMIRVTVIHNIRFSYFCLRLLIGEDECAPPHEVKPPSEPKKKSLHFALFYKYLKYVQQLPQIQNKNHPTCKHKYHCLLHVLLVNENGRFIKSDPSWICILGFCQTIFRWCSNPIAFTFYKFSTSIPSSSNLIFLNIKSKYAQSWEIFRLLRSNLSSMFSPKTFRFTQFVILLHS